MTTHPLLQQIDSMRIRRGMTRALLGKLADVDVRNVTRWLNGHRQPRLEHLEQLVEAVGGRLVIDANAADEPAAAHLRDITTAIKLLAVKKINERQLWEVVKRCETYIERLDGGN